MSESPNDPSAAPSWRRRTPDSAGRPQEADPLHVPVAPSPPPASMIVNSHDDAANRAAHPTTVSDANSGEAVPTEAAAGDGTPSEADAAASEAPAKATTPAKAATANGAAAAASSSDKSTPTPGGKKPTQGRRDKRKKPRRLALVVVMALILAAVFWAGWVVGGQQGAAPSEQSQTVWSTVEERAVGREMTFSVSIRQERTVIAANQMSGTITSISDKQEFGEGDEVYAVNAIPVRVVQGTMPFYRALARGDSGPDVRQLSEALTRMGYLESADDEFGPRTEAAVKAWQRAVGQKQTGVIDQGQLIAIPELPQALFYDVKGHPIGSLVSQGDDLVRVRQGAPEFLIAINPQQIAMIPEGVNLTVLVNDQEFPAKLGPAYQVEGGPAESNFYTLIAPDGAAVCGAQCSALPPDEMISAYASVQVVQEKSGPSVPVGALRLDPSGQATVLRKAGDGVEEVSVTPLATQNGVSVVDGLDVGDEVLVSDPDSHYSGAGPGGSPGGTPGGSPGGTSGGGN